MNHNWMKRTAMEKYYQLCHDIDCDFEEKTSYVYSKDAPWKLEEEAEALHQIGYGAEIAEVSELPFQTAGSRCVFTSGTVPST